MGWYTEYIADRDARDEHMREPYKELLEETKEKLRQLEAKAAKLALALEDLYETVKAEHGIDESSVLFDTSALGIAKHALADYKSKT